MFVNGAYQGKDDLGKLVHDLKTANPEDMYFTNIAQAVKYFKEEEGVKKMNKISEEIKQEGIEIGRIEGYSEGQNDTVNKALKNLADHLIKNSKNNLTEKEALSQAEEILALNI